MRVWILFTAISATVLSLAAQTAAKKRIAVFDFENAAASGGVTSPYFSSEGPNTGKAAANLLITKLVQNGNVVVIERSAIDKLLAEQNLTNSDRTDPRTAAKLGRVLGVDAIVLGTITQFDLDDKMTGGGGARLGGFGGYSTSTKHDIRATAKISARIVSPDTAEVLLVSEGAGEVVKKGVKVDMRDMRAATAAMMGGTNTNNPNLTEALNKAVEQLTGSLESAFPKLPPRVRVIDGLVADFNETGRLIINVGQQAGVLAGEKLEVWRAGKEIRDPGTGKVLMRDDILLGEASVTAVQENASIATFQAAGTERPKPGDLVKSPTKK